MNDILRWNKLISRAFSSRLCFVCVFLCLQVLVCWVWKRNHLHDNFYDVVSTLLVCLFCASIHFSQKLLKWFLQEINFLISSISQKKENLFVFLSKYNSNSRRFNTPKEFCYSLLNLEHNVNSEIQINFSCSPLKYEKNNYQKLCFICSDEKKKRKKKLFNYCLELCLETRYKIHL